MAETEKHRLDAESVDMPEGGKTRKKKGKSLMETMREIDAKEAQREAEAEQRRQEILAEREKQEKEAYAKKIQQERIELMRLKQGVITESDTIYEQKEEKPKLSFWKKITNFFYHNKWWLFITIAIAGVFAFLIGDWLMKVRPDAIVMVLTDDVEIQSRIPEIEAYLEQFADDENGDGKIQVDVYPIPVNDNIDEEDYYTGNGTKLVSQFHLGDSVLILTDTKANSYILAEQTLENLEESYPDCENARKQGYYVRKTDFATKIGYPGLVDRDLAFSLRIPIKTYDSLEAMQENYDVAKKMLKRIMEDLDGTQPPEDVPATKTTGEEN